MGLRNVAEESSAVGRAEIGAIIRDLARFRYALRTFLRFSEDAARQCGVTPQQHQLMLGVAGYSSGRSATISELAEFLQERVHSVVGLVERAERKGLVRSRKSKKDHRVVVVSLTGNGATILSRLCRIHYREANRMEGFRGYQFLPSSMPGRRK